MVCLPPLCLHRTYHEASPQTTFSVLFLPVSQALVPRSCRKRCSDWDRFSCLTTQLSIEILALNSQVGHLPSYQTHVTQIEITLMCIWCH